MSYPKIFGQLALSSAVAASGAAQAQPDIYKAFLVSAIVTSVDTSSPRHIDLPHSNHELANLMSVPGNMANVRACFKEHAIDEKPLQEIAEKDARTVVNCTDRKILSQFLRNPLGNRYAIGERIDFYTSEYLQSNDNFAQRVAAHCKGTGLVGMSYFANCAKGVFADDKQREFAIAGAGGSVLLGAVVASYLITRRRSRPEEPAHKGPGMSAS